MTVRRGFSRREFLKTISVPAGAVALAGTGLALRGGCGPAGTADPCPALGANASLGGKQVFPADNAWNTDVSAMPADPDSDTLIASIGLDKPLHPDFGTVYKGAPIG